MNIPESFYHIQKVNGSYIAVGKPAGGIYRFNRSGFSVLKEKLNNNNISMGGVHAVDDMVYVWDTKKRKTIHTSFSMGE